MSAAQGPPNLNITHSGWTIFNEICHLALILVSPGLLDILNICGCHANADACSSVVCSCHRNKLACSSYCTCEGTEERYKHHIFPGGGGGAAFIS